MKKKFSKLTSVFLSLIMMVSLLSINLMASAWSPDEGIEVYLDGAYVDTVEYDTMSTNASSTTTFSGRNNYGTYKSYTGKLYKFDQLMTAVKKSDEWTNAPGNTEVKIQAPDNFTGTILKSQLVDTRNRYDSNRNLVSSDLPFGFIEYTKDGSTYFKFAYGQLSSWDTNVRRFVDCKGTGNTKVYIDTSYTPSQCGEIYALEGSDTTTKYYATHIDGVTNGSGTTINTTVGTEINFNKDDNTYWDSVKIYRNIGSDLNSLDDPTPSTSILYNYQATRFGGAYNAITFSDPGTYYIKAMGYGYGMTDSSVYTFTVVVS